VSEFRKFGYIDAARGVAILMVVLVHTAQTVPQMNFVVRNIAAYGQMGVQLFFVVSAFTLCLAMERRSTEPLPIRSFFIRRFFRIAPLYYVGIVFYALTHLLETCLIYKAGCLESSPYSVQNIAANVFFIHGFTPQANNIVVPGGWSIGTEMAFYAVFPVLFWIIKRNTNPLLASVLLIITAATISACTYLFSAQTGIAARINSFQYFNISTQLPVFALGIASYFGTKSEHSMRTIKSIGSRSFAFLVFTVAALLTWDADTVLTPAFVPILSGLSFACLLSLLRTLDAEANSNERQLGIDFASLFKIPLLWLKAIGRVSFSMYIFHFFFAKNLPLLSKRIDIDLSPTLSLLTAFLIVTSITYGISRLTEHFIEDSGVRAGRSFINRIQKANLALHS